jgi:dipeptidyl aminopeptidase/acylaminoacyl peptidase
VWTGRFELYQKLASGAGKDDVLLQSEKDKMAYDWSRDGRFILFRELQTGGLANMWILPMSGDRKASAFFPTPFGQAAGRISPDGRWVAYDSNESGSYQPVVQSFPSAGGGKWQVTSSGGSYLRWRRDGKELYYVAPDGSLMAVPVGVTGSGADVAVELGTPEPLFNVPIVGGMSRSVGFRQQYDVSSDGQRFLVNLETASSDSPITVVVHWPSLLKQRR